MLGALTIFPLPTPPFLVQNFSKDEYMQEAESDHNKSNIAPAVITTHTKRIGIIHPPPDMRKVVDKTASVVAKNGPEFEKRIINENAGNPKFKFLNASHPYHAYYQHRLHTPAPESTPTIKLNDSTEKTNVKRLLHPPEAEQYTIRLREGFTISGEELDIIKLTAQFVAVNGDSFFNGLTSRENNNLMFNFLKPAHGLFVFFKSLKDTYTKVLMPRKELTDKLKENVKDVTTVLERCLHRLEWEHLQEHAKQKDEDEKEEERLAMSMIDWHDFVVVDNLEDFIFVDNEEIVEVDTETEKMKIVEDWKRPEDRIPVERNQNKHVVSPFTGELIPDNEMSQHMRFSLIDPKFSEQKERRLAKNRETSLAHGDEITRNIDHFARTHPDIFGITEEEVSNAQNASIAEDQIAGVNGGKNLYRPTGPPPPPRPGLALNLPIAQYSAVTSGGLVPVINTMVIPVQPSMKIIYGQQPYRINRPPPCPFMFQHGMSMVPPQHMPQETPPLPEEPEPKKRRLEDSLLVPEDQFLAQHQGPVCVSISIPNVDAENLKRQALEITVPFLSETVGKLKENVSREIHVPANKQKLRGKAGFLKDNLSLAYYNVGEGDMLFLSLRERGGRKR